MGLHFQLQLQADRLFYSLKHINFTSKKKYINRGKSFANSAYRSVIYTECCQLQNYYDLAQACHFAQSTPRLTKTATTTSASCVLFVCFKHYHFPSINMIRVNNNDHSRVETSPITQSKFPSSFERVGGQRTKLVWWLQTIKHDACAQPKSYTSSHWNMIAFLCLANDNHDYYYFFPSFIWHCHYFGILVLARVDLQKCTTNQSETLHHHQNCGSKMGSERNSIELNHHSTEFNCFWSRSSCIIFERGFRIVARASCFLLFEPENRYRIGHSDTMAFWRQLCSFHLTSTRL